MRLGLIGCGVIGERRVQNLPAQAILVNCFDPNAERAQLIASKYNCKIASSADEVLDPSKIDGVILAGINQVLPPYIQAALDKGIHVLVEKPAARNFKELESLKNPKNCVIKIGFNHRFHPAFKDLIDLIQKEPDDPIMFIRAQYGNGARVGFDKEWRSKAEIAGGGELLDQGVHVLDLASVLLPGLKVQAGYTRTHYWNMEVDDNAWGILDSPNGATFSFHVSSSEWKNEFRFEVYTRKKKLQWLGLGRSYGPEKLIVHRMKPEMGPPVTEEISYPDQDNSWLHENENFLAAIQNSKKAWGDLNDAIQTLKLVEQIYQSSKKIQSGSERKHPAWY